MELQSFRGGPVRAKSRLSSADDGANYGVDLVRVRTWIIEGSYSTHPCKREDRDPVVFLKAF